MIQTKKTLRSLSFLFFSIFVVACSRNGDVVPLSPTPGESTITQSPPAVTSTVMDEVLPSETISVQPTAPLPTNTALPETQPPMITATPVSSPTPAPLTETGPWLASALLSEDVYENWRPLVANLDGSGYQILEAVTAGDPIIPWWRPEFSASSLGGYLATIALKDQVNFELLIFELPNPKPIRTISLMSQMAQQAAAQFEQDEEVGCWEVLPPVLLSLMWETAFQWSPDGRYLAFVGAMDGPNTDVYIYDTQEDDYIRLTSGENQASILSWSPDSQWIVHESVEYYCADGPNYAVPDSMWAVNIQGKIRKLYDVSAPDHFTGWVDDDSFLVASMAFETDYWDLRQINIQTGDIEPLYESGFGDVATNQDIILITSVGHWGARNPELQGILQISENMIEPQILLPGEYQMLWWYPELELFSATGRNDQDGLTIFSSDGRIHHTFPQFGWISPSPDGSFMLLDMFDTTNLYDKEGNTIEQFDLRFATITWLPDSTGFYRCSGHHIYRHSQSEDWTAQEIKVPEVSCYPLLLITP